MAHGRRAGHETTRRARQLRSRLAAIACCTLVAATSAASAGAAGPAWTGGLELQLPANAYPSAPETVLDSVACPGAGILCGVGVYTDDAGVDRALAPCRPPARAGTRPRSTRRPAPTRATPSPTSTRSTAAPPDRAAPSATTSSTAAGSGRW
jgi:hypothetical protein